MTSTTLSHRNRSQSGAEGKVGKPWVKGQIAPSQIKAIHTIIHKFGLDDEAYRHLLHSHYGVTSSKNLTWRQAEELLEHLNGGSTPLTRRAGPRAESRGGLKYTDMDHRPGFASGAQLRLIDAMWNQISKAEGDEAREKALNSFINRIAHVAGIRMLKSWQVERIVKALEAMGAEKK